MKTIRQIYESITEETTYQNPWYDPKNKYSERTFKTTAKPEEYKGFHIYHRIQSVSKDYKQGQDVFDIVYKGKLVSQVAGPDGARRAIDKDADKFIEFANKQVNEKFLAADKIDQYWDKEGYAKAYCQVHENPDSNEGV